MKKQEKKHKSTPQSGPGGASLIQAYLLADTWQTRQQILSLFANDFSKGELQEMIPGLTICRIDQARLHAMTAGFGQPIEEQKPKTRVRLDPLKADHFIDFISQPSLLQDVAYGTRKMKLETGETVLMPNVIRSHSISDHSSIQTIL